jgi:hypothetical protein
MVHTTHPYNHATAATVRHLPGGGKCSPLHCMPLVFYRCWPRLRRLYAHSLLGSMAAGDVPPVPAVSKVRPGSGRTSCRRTTVHNHGAVRGMAALGTVLAKGPVAWHGGVHCSNNGLPCSPARSYIAVQLQPHTIAHCLDGYVRCARRSVCGVEVAGGIPGNADLFQGVRDARVADGA